MDDQGHEHAQGMRLRQAVKMLDGLKIVPGWNPDQILAILILLELRELNGTMADIADHRNFRHDD